MVKQINSLNQWIKENSSEYNGRLILPLLECKDGLALGLKVGEGAKSKPSKNLNKSDQLDYIQVEVPFVLEEGKYTREMLFDDFEVGVSGRYTYVPVSLIEYWVNQHGGCEN